MDDLTVCGSRFRNGRLFANQSAKLFPVVPTCSELGSLKPKTRSFGVR